MEEFGPLLRKQIADAAWSLEQARAARDPAGIKQCGLLLRYLQAMAREQQSAREPGDPRPREAR